MSTNISANYTQRFYNWTEWKNILNIKQFIHQFDDDGYVYHIWGYDGPELHITKIWKYDVPEIYILEGYTQEQNDADKNDFELNYQSSANKTLNKLTITGVSTHAPAKGLGGFFPDPINNVYEPNPDELVSLYVDGEGSLITRGATVTDEGSLREDFNLEIQVALTGTITFTNGSDIVTGVDSLFTEEISRDFYIKPPNSDIWYLIIRAPNNNTCQIEPEFEGETIVSDQCLRTRWIVDKIGGNLEAYSINNSYIILNSDVHDGYGINIYRQGDYLPTFTTFIASISQRVENQILFIGARDDINNPSMYCDIIFDGYNDTLIKFRSAWKGSEELSTIKLPSGLTTNMFLRYKIDASAEYCGLSINGVSVAKHQVHIPDPYTELYICAGLLNLANINQTTELSIDTVFFSNQDQIQIANSFLAPIPIVSIDDQHTISGQIKTNSTSSNQEIINYTVPYGKVFYIIGYRIECIGTLEGLVEIGKNSIDSDLSYPGNLNGNIFRIISLMPGKNTGEVDFASPRKFGVGGEVIKITVTPKGSLSCKWYAVLDFILR